MSDVTNIEPTDNTMEAEIEQQDAVIEQEPTTEANNEKHDETGVAQQEEADIEADIEEAVDADMTTEQDEMTGPAEDMLQLDEENMHDDDQEEPAEEEAPVEPEPEADEPGASDELEQAVEAEEELANMWGGDEAAIDEEPAEEEPTEEEPTEEEPTEEEEQEQEAEEPTQEEEEQTYEEEPTQEEEEEPEEEPEEEEEEPYEEEEEEEEETRSNNVRTGGFASTSSFDRDTASGGSGDVFSRLYSTHTGTHKHGGRRAVSVVHSTRMSTTSVYGGGAARDTSGANRGWLRIAEETPGPQHGLDPHARTTMAGRAQHTAGYGDARRGRMATSARFRPTDAKGCFRSRRDLEDEANRELTSAPPAEQGMTGTGGGGGRAHSWGKTDRFVARHANGRYLSKRDLKDTAERDAISSSEVYSSFKVNGGGSKSAFGGTVDRFRPRTAKGHFLSRRNKDSSDDNKENSGTEAYSSFRQATAKSSSSSYFGGSTARFEPAGKRNGGLVTPGPGAFELDAGTKGCFGTSSHAPISLLA